MDHYYIVRAVCGHVGMNWSVDKDFPVVAESGKEAAEKVRNMPRVKHDFKYAIRSCREVDYYQYREQLEVYENDPYFQCHSRQEQNRLCQDLEKYESKDHDDRRFKEYDRSDRGRKAYVNRYLWHGSEDCVCA